jgi:tetratricopeptide (TPR) repeat protein
MREYTSGIDAKSSDKDVNAKLHNNRALIHYKNKNYGKAVEDCKKSIEYKPDFAKAYHRCATVLLTLNKFKDAVEILNQGLKSITNE